MADGMIDLSGAFLPVTTPFASGTGDVDVPAFRANLSRWCENPVSGVLIAGSTGESVFLDEEERTMLVEAAADVVPQNAIVIAGTGSESTRHTIRLTQQAAAAGADAVLVSPPAYFKGAMSDDVLTDHFGAVAEASPGSGAHLSGSTSTEHARVLHAVDRPALGASEHCGHQGLSRAARSGGGARRGDGRRLPGAGRKWCDSPPGHAGRLCGRYRRGRAHGLSGGRGDRDGARRGPR